MELNELKAMWQAHETKLEKSAKLNSKILDMVMSQRVKSAVRPLVIRNSIILVFHTLAIVALRIQFFNTALRYFRIGTTWLLCNTFCRLLQANCRIKEY